MFAIGSSYPASEPPGLGGSTHLMSFAEKQSPPPAHETENVNLREEAGAWFVTKKNTCKVIHNSRMATNWESANCSPAE